MVSIKFGLTAAILVTSGMAHAQGTPPAGNAEAGANVFKKCRACHNVGPDAKNRVGPMLNGIVGRMAGENPEYSYSPAMKNSGLVWDEITLATYLHAPRALVPRTKMSFPGLSKNQDIADVIAYLKQFNADGQSEVKP